MLRTIVVSVLKRVIGFVVLINLLAPLLMLALSGRAGLLTPFEESMAADSVSTAAAASYAAHRSPLIDKLLPSGAGGTYVVSRLGGVDGIARTDRSLIALVATAAADEPQSGGASRGEVVEMHERAHLLDAAHPELISALLHAVPPPDSMTYAATSPREHFAEMAGNAWRIVRMQDNTGYCPAYDAMIGNTEAEVPGTAGMVMWFLREWQAARDTAIDARLLAAATARSAAYDHEWRAIAAAVEQQRDSNGVLAPWPVPGVAQSLRTKQVMMINAPEWWGRTLGWLLLPSVVMTRLVEP